MLLAEAMMSILGGTDTYYDYDERCWKYRRLGGGRVQGSAGDGAVRRPERTDVPISPDVDVATGRDVTAHP
jgi:hypothetical protein